MRAAAAVLAGARSQLLSPVAGWAVDEAEIRATARGLDAEWRQVAEPPPIHPG